MLPSLPPNIIFQEDGSPQHYRILQMSIFGHIHVENCYDWKRYTRPVGVNGVIDTSKVNKFGLATCNFISEAQMDGTLEEHLISELVQSIRKSCF